ncbi:unnamed protein product [Darwinula stevensoni]|uniref:Phosphofurin acidic cluster sorting protein 1/2 C-terminal domain-containing protein n=1 Tax=Darwinula stevensoni TaxID=69355 RepID=A0A7R9FRU5_9CRUS|nr:unnamed protein product [Darwinula stevensoni]CAG0902129.1 unnamed protein product [Darwinula stevensoni]
MQHMGSSSSLARVGIVYKYLETTELRAGSAGERDGEDSDDEDEYSSNEDGSDSEPMMEEPLGPSARKAPRGKDLHTHARQRNLKQRFVALLKRFKVSEDLQTVLAGNQEIEQKLSGGEIMDPEDIDDLLNEFDDLSDSGGEVDNISVSSTPKPSLRPFFSSSRSLVSETVPEQEQGARGSDRMSDENSKKGDSDSHPEHLTDAEGSDPTLHHHHYHHHHPPLASSPPKASSGDERKDKEREKEKEKEKDKEKEKGEKERLSGLTDLLNAGARFFPKDKPSANVGIMLTKDKKLSVLLHKDKDRGALEKTIPAVVEPSPRRVVLEQLGRLFPPDEPGMPENLVILNTCDPQGAHLASLFQQSGDFLPANACPKVICTASAADVKATFVALFSKIQKFCNSNAKAPPSVKVALVGSESHVNAALRTYVEQLATKSPDWLAYLHFLILPLGVNALSKYICSVDSVYNNMFGESGWRDLLEKEDKTKKDTQEVVSRIGRYLGLCCGLLHLPVAEAMVTYKGRGSDEESSQIFIPFVNEVRIAFTEVGASTSVDLEEASPGGQSNFGGSAGPSSLPPVSGSPPQSSHLEVKKDTTPPSSPNISSTNPPLYTQGAEPMDLQLEWWLAPGSKAALEKEREAKEKGKSEVGSGKSSLKAGFWSVIIQRRPPFGQTSSSTFTMTYSLKEKKQKNVIQRLGGKKKENESRSQTVEGINRLVCLAKSHHYSLKVTIDGVEWSGVKFFQLSAQWQTHVRHFPIATMSPVTSSGMEK